MNELIRMPGDKYSFFSHRVYLSPNIHELKGGEKRKKEKTSLEFKTDTPLNILHHLDPLIIIIIILTIN